MMIIVILIVAGFGIYNILNMTVNQKKKEIAILRSIGFKPTTLFVCFDSRNSIWCRRWNYRFSHWIFICNYLETIPLVEELWEVLIFNDFF